MAKPWCNILHLIKSFFFFFKSIQVCWYNLLRHELNFNIVCEFHTDISSSSDTLTFKTTPEVYYFSVYIRECRGMMFILSLSLKKSWPVLNKLMRSEFTHFFSLLEHPLLTDVHLSICSLFINIRLQELQWLTSQDICWTLTVLFSGTFLYTKTLGTQENKIVNLVFLYSFLWRETETSRRNPDLKGIESPFRKVDFSPLAIERVWYTNFAPLSSNWI